MSIHDIRPERSMTVVTFALGTQTLAVPAGILREILDPLPVTRVPGAGPFVPGVLNVRGGVVPLADLKQALTIPDEGSDDRRRILVLEVPIGGEPTTVAVAADAVHEVASVDTSIIEAVPASSHAWPPDCLSGLYRGSQGFVLLPNLETIFSNLASRPLAAQP